MAPAQDRAQIQLPSLSSGHQRIPGFRESGFLDLVVTNDGPKMPQVTELPTPPGNSPAESYFDRQAANIPRRSSVGWTEPRMMNTTAAPVPVQAQQPAPMYHFRGARPMLSVVPESSYPRMMPSPATSAISPSNSLMLAPGMIRKEPCQRAAAKRMRDTRNREGDTLKGMEDDLEAEGRLEGAKRLNANNKDESGRRYSRADILERYRRRTQDKNHQYDELRHFCDAVQFKLGNDDKASLGLLLEKHKSWEMGGRSDRYSDRSCSPDYDHESPTTAEWSSAVDEEPNYIATGRNKAGCRP